MSEGKIKLFEIHDCDYVVATNARQAVRCWSGITWSDKREALENCVEVDRKQWSKYTFFYDDVGKKRTTFEKRIKEILESGEEKVPFFLASSEF